MNRSPRKSAAQWSELVSEFASGTENEHDFCTRHGLKLVTLRKWRYHFKNQTNPDTRRTRAPFVKVNVSQPRVSNDAAVLCIGSDVRLECPVSYDVSSLAQLALAVHYGR